MYVSLPLALRMSKNNLRKEATVKLAIAQIILAAMEENIDVVIDSRFKRQRGK
jgi:hypothetical protein